MAQVERIQKEASVNRFNDPCMPYFYFQVEETSDYVSEKEDVSCLIKEYASDDTIYQTKIKVEFFQIMVAKTKPFILGCRI